jgi:hypothetical protein
MNLISRAGASALVAAIISVVGAAYAAPVGPLPHDAASAPAQQVEWRGGPKGGWHEWDQGRGWGWGGAAAGFALGAAVASPWYGYGYDYAPGYYGYGYDPSYYSYGYHPGYSSYGYSDYGYAPGAYATSPGGDVGYCMSRYRSYDPSSGTYMGYDGIRHPCP